MRRSTRSNPTVALSATATRLPAAAGRRRGVALLMILLLISMVLGLSYAAVRSQYTAVQVQQNSDRRTSARHVAVTGLTMAIKKMHAGDWNGVDSTLTGGLSPHEEFQVTFETGDPSLTAGDPEYDEFPYRVTLLSTGYARDPSGPSRVATHRIRAVLRFVPRHVAAEPAGWSDITQNTLCQYTWGSFKTIPPIQIAGPVRIRARLDACTRELDWDRNTRDWYIDHLDWMRQWGGFPDYRPFTGPVKLKYDSQEWDTVWLLQSHMGVTTLRTSNSTNFTFSGSSQLATYRLYPGGTLYNAVTLSSENLANTTLEPDPETNPLGIFIRSGKVKLQGNVTIKGTLITTDDVEVHGPSNRVLPVEVPPFENPNLEAEARFRLPTLVSANDFKQYADSELDAAGLIMAKDDFEIKSDNQSHMLLKVEGKVVAKDILLSSRENWDRDHDWWEDALDDYLDFWGGPLHQAFPDWLDDHRGLDPRPRLIIKPDAAMVRYHCHNSGDPIYTRHPDDDGLRWDLLEWTENP